MQINYVVEQSAPRKRKLDTDEEAKFTDFFWETVGAVRRGVYKVKNFNSVPDQVEEERRLNEATKL